MPRRIGILFGKERTFPPALAARIDQAGRGQVSAEMVQVGPFSQEEGCPYDVVLDRISHEVPFYRTWLKSAAARGTQVVNNPFWWSADDKFLDNVLARAAGVAVPKTVLLPHKQHPPNTDSDSYTNLVYPVDWDAVFSYLGFPIFMKPADGGGWRDVYKVSTPDEFLRAYDQTHTLSMMAQEAIEFTEYYRCYVLGRERVRIMRYDPRAPFERRYVRDAAPSLPSLMTRIEMDCLTLCRELGYDFNTVEFAVRGGVPYAIDFMNPAPDCDSFSVGEESFRWVVDNAADLLIDRALRPRPVETAGRWPDRAAAAAPASAPSPARASAPAKASR